MKKKKFNENKGILFFIIDFSTSKKSLFLIKFKNRIQKKYGETLILDHDNMRKIFNLKKFSKEQRFKQNLKYITLAKFLTNNCINVILCITNPSHEAFKLVNKQFDNYLIITNNQNEKTIRKNIEKNFIKNLK